MDILSGAENIQSHSHGIYTYTLLDDRIHVLVSEGRMDEKAIDTWFAVCRATVTRVPVDVPLYGLMDLRGKYQGMTDYAFERGRELANFAMGHRHNTYLAVIVNYKGLGDVFDGVASRLLLNGGTIDWRVFVGQQGCEDALVWLKSLGDWTPTSPTLTA